MSPDKQQQLYDAFPTLYKQRHQGFECGDGWFQLLWDLSEKLTQFKGVEVTQVKSKYGSLRYYYDTPASMADNVQVMVSDLVEEAEAKSAETCETCGEPGELYPVGWYYTACPKHVRK